MKKTSNILAIERRNRIMDLANKNKSILVTELSREFGVSEETIRRDLDKLQEQGILVRTYGGAVIQGEKESDFPVNVRETMNISAKIRIAKKASGMISDGDCIFLDASSSSYYLSKEIRNKRITVITNAINVINELAGVKNISLISTGGNLYPNHMAFFGLAAKKTIELFNADILFFSCKGISHDFGLTDADELISDSHITMMKHSEKVILLCDSSKLEKTSFISTAGFEAVDRMITEKEVPLELVKVLAEHKTELIIA